MTHTKTLKTLMLLPLLAFGLALLTAAMPANAFASSSFTVGKDSNAFKAAADSFNDSSISLGDTYYSLLTEGATHAEVSAIKVVERGRFWATQGSTMDDLSYGISVTMSMLSNGNLSASQLSANSADGYFDLGTPSDNSRLKNAIYYYQLTQNLDKYNLDDMSVIYTVNSSISENISDWCAGGQTLSSFLKKLVDYASGSKTGVLAYTNGEGGHAVVIAGCQANAAGEYEIKLYDPNSYEDASNPGDLITLYVAGNYSSFRFSDAADRAAGKTTLNSSTYQAMYLIDPASMKSLSQVDDANVDTDDVTIEILVGASFYLEDEEGRYLQYKDGVYSGNMTVKDFYSIINGANSRHAFTVSYSEAYYFYDFEDNTPFGLSHVDGIGGGRTIGAYMMTIRPGWFVTFGGDCFKYLGHTSTDEELSDNEHVLFEVTAENCCNCELNVGGDRLQIAHNSDVLKNVVATYLEGQKTSTMNIGDTVPNVWIVNDQFPEPTSSNASDDFPWGSSNGNTNGNSTVVPDSETATRFATSLYTDVLGRQPDEEGLETQYNALMNGYQPAEIAFNYFDGPEYTYMGVSNEETVKRVYRVMFGREADDAGLAYWKAYLDNGMTIRSVVQGFSEATEYKEYYRANGLNNATISRDTLCPRDKSYGATAFAYRMYTIVLSRAAEAEGLDTQSAALQDGTPCVQLAVNFFLSDEFAAKGPDGYGVVKTCYKALLGRPADEGEYDYWIDRLRGEGLESIVRGFCESDEFEAICQEYDLTSGMR